MEQENIQIQTIENKQQKTAKWILRILLAITFIALIIFIYKLFYVDAFWHNYDDEFMLLKKEAFMYSFFILIALVLNFLPYFIAKRLFKKGRYIRQVIWGILTFVVFQFLIYWAVLAIVCGWCTDREAIKKYEQQQSIVPCIPNPAAGINCY